MKEYSKRTEYKIALAEAAQLAIARELYKKSFYDFFCDAVRVLKPTARWQFNWHHKYLCDLLQKEAFRIRDNKKKPHDLLINIPPSTTKSTIVSVCLQAWVWGCVDPSHIFLNVSNSDDLAIEFATDCKDLIESEWYRSLFPEVELRIDTSAKSNYRNTKGGQRISLSMRSTITGYHANWIILDDPLDAKDISSIVLEKNIANYRAIYTRLSDPNVDLRVVIGQRIHENDTSGYILSRNQKNSYKHICLPIELTDDVKPASLKKYYKSGVLWHDRFPPETFEDLADSSFMWASQYLQNPKPTGGMIVKDEWLEVVETVPSGIIWHLFIDPAYTADKQNDPSGLMVAGISGNILYVKKVFEQWLEFPDLIKFIRKVVIDHCSPNCKVYIEPKASGKSIASQLKAETQLNVVELKAPTDSKEVRVSAITGKLETGRVKLLADEEWNDKFIYQATTFPHAKHDDMLDCLVMAVDTLFKTGGSITWYM